MNPTRAFFQVAGAGLIGFLLVACNSGPFSGSGSMRIEVEVYKGPLSQEPEIQWGELVGYLEEAKRALVQNANYTLAVVLNKDFKSLREKGIEHVDVNSPTFFSNQENLANSQRMFLAAPIDPATPDTPFKVTWCDSLDHVGLWAQLDYFDCVILRGVYVDSLNVIQEVNSLLIEHDVPLHGKEVPPEEAAIILRDVAKLSAELRAKGFRWAVATTAGQSFNIKVRMAVLNFIVAASEFGNQLQARADTLMKQSASGGRDRQELPLSSHLREAEPTDFVRLYDWLNGSLDALRYKVPEFLLSGMWPTDVTDRTTIVRRLFSDHFWSKINTVYASGKGKVGMAFVKDDLGNWNLKNFDNAPGELLDAYMKLGTSLVKRAGDLAVAVETGGSSEALKTIQGLLKEAQDVQGMLQAAPTAESEGAARLRSLSEKAAITLEAIGRQREEKDRALQEKLKVQQSKPAAQETLDEVKKNRHKTVKEMQEILFAYRQQVELIDKAVTTSAGTKPDATEERK